MITEQTYLKQLVSLDLRALALFRIALSIYLLVELFVNGFVAVQTVGFLPFDFSLQWQRVLAGAAVLACVASFAKGYKARWSAFLLWLAYACLHMGPDADRYHALICAVLLLCVFLPTARFFSLDDARDRGALEDGAYPVIDNSYASVGTVAVLLIMFGCVAGVIAASLSVGQARWPVVAGLSIIAAQLLPTLGALRLIFITLFVAAVAFAIRAQTGVEAFEYGLILVLATLMVPGSVFDWISERSVFSKRHDIRIYYDQPCGFCRKICFIFASFFMLGRCRIAAAQTDEAAHKLLRDNDSWVVFDGDGQHELCWAALLKLMRASPVWFPLGYGLSWIGMGSWGKPLYRLIGNSRNQLSKLTATLLPYTSYRYELRTYEKVLITFWMLLLAVHYSGASASAYGSVADIMALFGFSDMR
ncbi:MAG: DCC1-like thiol-disulfide oxidoreductase family protein [Gammaproteobacteria bacterium]